MPGYQQLRFMPQSTEHFQSEPIYGQIDSQKAKKNKQRKQHVLTEDPKLRNLRDRKEYERMMMAKDMSRGGDFKPYKFDSLKLIGSCNDINYLDNFMSMPRQQRRSQQNDFQNSRNRTKGISKSSSTIFGKGQQQQQPKEHRLSIQSDSNAYTAAVLASLRSVVSDDNIYESVEMIHYKKSMQNLNRIQKTRSVQKSGHSLFDSLRVEQALKAPTVKKTSRRGEESYSEGSSPTHSTSSSGDEYETYPRMRQHHHNNNRHASKTDQSINSQKHAALKSKRNDPNSSESDEDWRMIPRPKFLGGGRTSQQHQRRIDGGPPSSTTTDESDSSINSGMLR